MKTERSTRYAQQAAKAAAQFGGQLKRRRSSGVSHAVILPQSGILWHRFSELFLANLLEGVATICRHERNEAPDNKHVGMHRYAQQAFFQLPPSNYN